MAPGDFNEIQAEHPSPLPPTYTLSKEIEGITREIAVLIGYLLKGLFVSFGRKIRDDGIPSDTVFVLVKEVYFQAYQDRLLAAKESDTVITRAFTGRPARGLRNRFIEEYNKSGPQPLAWPLQALAADDIYATAQKQNNADYFPLLAGQGVAY